MFPIWGLALRFHLVAKHMPVTIEHGRRVSLVSVPVIFALATVLMMVMTEIQLCYAVHRY